MHFHIVTLFPGAFDSYLGESILKRAIEDKKIKVSFYNPRDFVKDKNKRIDKPPYGGGPGMVIQAEPVILAIAKAIASSKQKVVSSKQKSKKKPTAYSLLPTTKIIFLSPGGKQFTNDYASKTAKKYKNIILVSGRYEGIDARVKKIFKMEDISVGPFVLTGGELPAMLIMDVVARQIPGVLGNLDSIEERRVASKVVYTRPEVFKYKGKSYKVPKILLSGHRAEIEKWKLGLKK